MPVNKITIEVKKTSGDGEGTKVTIFCNPHKIKELLESEEKLGEFLKDLS